MIYSRNILSLGQATEQGCDVRIKENYLKFKGSKWKVADKSVKGFQ